MNHWPFIIGAYALTAIGVAAMTLWSWVAMRRSEAQAERLGRDREA